MQHAERVWQAARECLDERDEARAEAERLRAALRAFVDAWNEVCGDDYRTATTHRDSCPTASDLGRLCECGIRAMHEASNKAGWALEQGGGE